MLVIYPRSPREMMDGWVYLPRFIDKIRLHLAGKLATDYQDNFLKKGFDALWLQTAGVDGEKFVEVVRASVTDGEVFDWVRKNVKKTEAEKALLRETILNRGRDSEESKARLKVRKSESGITHRDDITCFVDFIDADEGRL